MKHIVLQNTAPHAHTYLNSISYVAACRGSPAELTEPEGTFGIIETEYENNMRCGWKIMVDSSKVSNLKAAVFPI